MITIGSFTKTPEGRFHGVIRTLTLNAENVEIRPVSPTADKAPDHRVFAGPTEVGAAWTLARENRPPGLSVRIDDPSLPAPLCALLVETEGGHELRWSRRG